MTETARYFSPREMADRLGLSIKALRVYEARGLIRPLRTAAGWRAYGPEQILRLHQIQALKGLGLPLARIADLLSGRVLALDAVLALREQALDAQHRRLDGALARVRAARRRLSAGETLSIEDLTTLTKETTMSDTESWNQIFDPIAAKHFTPDEMDALKDRPMAWDQAQVAAEWEALIAECKALMEIGDAASADAMDLAGRWMAQVAKFTGGDPTVFAKVGAVWGEAMADAAAAPRLPLNPAMFAFIGRAEAARKAKQA